MNLDEMKRKILSDRELVTGKAFQRRDFRLMEMEGMANVIVGARRVGKTSLMKYKAKKLIDDGLSLDHVCYLSFFTSVDLDFPFSLIEDAYYGLYPELENDDNVWFFLDEVQGIKNWVGGIAHLMEAHPCHVVVTGSSAKMLGTDIADELRGRCIPQKFYPLSFSEFLDFTGVSYELKTTYSDSERNMLAKNFDSYMKRSSYPQLAYNDDMELKRIILNSYFDLTFSRDIIDRFDISRSMMLLYLMRRVVKNSGSPYTIRKLVSVLESAGFKTSIPLVSSYLKMMCDTCFMSELPIYGTEKMKERNPKKMYVVDHQMAVLFREFGSSSGIILEHIVYSTILRYSKLNTSYYKTARDYEIDFLLSNDDGVPCVLLQVTDDFTTSREREVRALSEAMCELGLDHSFLVTKDEKETIKVTSGMIDVLPAWYFSLNAKDILSGECRAGLSVF